MHWTDEGYLLSKNNFRENSIITEVFTLKHGKSIGVVYGGSSRKLKKNFQIGNKLLINWISKGENRYGYFNTELIEPIAPQFFDHKKKLICLFSAASLLKLFLPERQSNVKIYYLFESLIKELYKDNSIINYINFEINLIKELGYGTILKKNPVNKRILDNLIFNKKIIVDNFIEPNKLKLPYPRIILEKYYV